MFMMLGIIVQAQVDEISLIEKTTEVEINMPMDSPGVVVYGEKPLNKIHTISCGVVITAVNVQDLYPFKVYVLNSEEEHWNTQQEVYASIQRNVPGVRISNSYPNETPQITMRGCDNPVVIVDGVRYDASILQTLNPANIETIAVSNSIAATNYFLNNRN